MNKATTVERLEKLIELVIEVIPDESFDFDIWRDYDASHTEQHTDFFSGFTTEELLDKNIVGCLIGWATSVEYFQNLGFNFHGSVGPIFMYEKILINEELKDAPVVTVPVVYQWKAVREFFGITQEDALVMFSYDNYDQAKIDKDTMIRFIERIIQKYK